MCGACTTAVTICRAQASSTPGSWHELQKCCMVEPLGILFRLLLAHLLQPFFGLLHRTPSERLLLLSDPFRLQIDWRFRVSCSTSFRLRFSIKLLRDALHRPIVGRQPELILQAAAGVSRSNPSISPIQSLSSPHTEKSYTPSLSAHREWRMEDCRCGWCPSCEYACRPLQLRLPLG